MQCSSFLANPRMRRQGAPLLPQRPPETPPSSAAGCYSLPFQSSGLKGSRGDGELRQIHSMRFFTQTLNLSKSAKNETAILGNQPAIFRGQTAIFPEPEIRNILGRGFARLPFCLFFCVFGGSSGSSAPGCCARSRLSHQSRPERAKGQTGKATA